MSGETFAWWRHLVRENREALIVSVHHYVLKDTTVASGDWEGMRKDPSGKWISHYHGYFERGTPRGASYLYWVGGKPDSGAFERYLEEHPGAVQLWLGGHTHTHPDDRYGGKSHIEQKWGAHFLNISALTKYHARRTTMPMSRLLTFVEGSTEVLVQCYLHTSDYARQGWYGNVERTLKLARPFRG